MTKKTLRTVQPAHKSDKVTVSQAKKAWLKTARERTMPNGPSMPPNNDRSNACNPMNPRERGDHER